MSAGLDGIRVVVTAGGTREAVDPVRYVGNRSSGKMGNALVAAVLEVGGGVTLISTVSIPEAGRVPTIRVTSAEEMLVAVRAVLPETDVLIMAAAVADYRPSSVAESKLKKRPAGMTLELVPTVDVLVSIREEPHREDVFVVGFAAETHDLIDNAQRKLRDKALDLIVVNDVATPGIGMGADDNAVTIIDAEGIVAEVTRRPKLDVARVITSLVAARVGIRAGPDGASGCR